MADSVGTAKIVLAMDASDFTATIAQSKNQVTSLATATASAFNESTLKARGAATSLARYVELIGKSADEAKLLRAQWNGVDTKVLVEVAAKMDAIRASEAATVQVNKELSDSWTAMQAKARAAFSEIQSAAREQQLIRDAAAARAAAKAIDQQAASQRTFERAVRSSGEYSGQYGDRVNRMRDAVAAFSSAEQLKNQQMRAGHTVQQKSINLMNEYGLTAKQQSAALRQVPAQVTDIFVSLQGGQNPLTVLLQQGGQLKDVFGGVVPAARALGGAIMGLVNPYTLLAGAVGIVSLAYLQAEGRQNAFNRSLIMTGQQGRLTADDLAAMTTRLDAVQGITGRQGADALAQLVATGKVAAGQLELVAQAAARMEDVTGKAMKDTIAEYAEFGRDPVSALLKYGEAEGFLTSSIYERVRALQESGQIEAAAAAATEARATAQIERTAQVVESLGLVSGAWFSIKENTGEAWDAAVTYFADLDRDAKEAAGTLSNLWASFKQGGVGGMFGMQQALFPAASALPKPAADKPLNVEAVRQLQSIVDANKSAAERQTAEETRIRNLGKAAQWTTEQINAQVAASRKSYEASLPKDRKTGTGAARSLANAESGAALQAIKDALSEEQNALANSGRLLQAQYSARLVTVEDYYRQQRAITSEGVSAEAGAIEEQIAYLKSRNVAGKDSVNTLKQIGQLEAQLAKVRADGATQLIILGIQEADVSAKRKRSVDAYAESLDTANDAARRSAAAAVAGIMLSEREAARRSKIADIIAETADKERELAREFADNNDKSVYDEKLALLQDYTDERVRITQQGFADMDRAQADWLNGVATGVANWMDKTADVASQTAAITNNVLDGSVNAMTTWATTGENIVRELLIDMGKEITAFFMKKAIMQFVQMFLGGWTGGGSGSMNGDSGSLGSLFQGISTNAKGNAFNNSPTLSAYSGTVVDKPTFFAKGGNVMGEAGPEGIFPLERGPDGKLGVSAHGAGGGSQVNISINTTINKDGSSSEEKSGGESDDALHGFTERMRSVAQQEVNRAMRPNGQLWKAGVRAS